MSLPFILSAGLTSGPLALGRNLVQLLSTNRRYTKDVGELVNTLCERIGRNDLTAPMELWRLVQGLHFGGALSPTGLESVERQLNTLRPQWRSQ
jgi:hypothetical protein